MAFSLSLPVRAFASGAILVFGLGSAGAIASGPVRGPQWSMASDPADAQRFVQFDGGGRMMGSGGCNRFSGSYELTKSSLKVAAIVATRRACAEDVMAREAAFFKALEAATEAIATKDELVLKGADGQVLLTLARRG